MTTKESTVAEWQSHFKSNPYQTLPEYKLDWTTIRNNAEGVGVDVGLGTIQKYLKKFRHLQNVDAFYVPEVPVVESDPIASLLILQSQLGSLTIAAEKYVGQCKYINDVLDTTLSMLQENVIWSELEAKAAKLESELSLAQANVKSLEVEATAQKELRLRAVNKTVYGS